MNYRLTEKGIDLAPVVLDLFICAVIDAMESNREQVLAEVRRRWDQRDLTPFLPKFKTPGKPGRGKI